VPKVRQLARADVGLMVDWRRRERRRVERDGAGPFERTLDICPLVAILRGVTPEAVVGIAEELHAAGFRVVEVPLNSPRPLESIARLAESFADRLLVGAGTVLSVAAVTEVEAAGGRIIVSPHMDPQVVGAALTRGLDVLPGAMTPRSLSEKHVAMRPVSPCTARSMLITCFSLTQWVSR